jgi:hypothetical protein
MTTPSASPTQTISPSPEFGTLWDVQEILAERTTCAGEGEFLVALKPRWIPVSQMHADCPAILRFKGTSKLTFASDSGALRIQLPVELGTVLAQDLAEEKELVTRAKARAPIIAAALADHTLRAYQCPCSLCAMHAGLTAAMPHHRTIEMTSSVAAPNQKRRNTENQ